MNGQLGHDVVKELLRRGHAAIGSGSGHEYKGVNDLKVFVTGVGGQLGHDVVNHLINKNHEAIGTDIAEQYSGVNDGSAVVSAPYVQLDITDEKAVREAVEKIHPDAIIHCAAWTNVDGAEAEENREKVKSINADGTRYIAEAAKAVDAKMLYLSTDYVFNGQGTFPWKPEDKNYAPLNVYGRSKLDGEQAGADVLEKFFIVRIAWVFGRNGSNFVRTILRIGKDRDFVTVVDDQIGTPTYTPDLSRLLADMIETDIYGYYHATNSESSPGEFISWYDFCCELYRQYGLKTSVIPVSTAEYGLSKAARPFNSRLDKSKLTAAGFKALPAWQDAVSRYLKEAHL